MQNAFEAVVATDHPEFKLAKLDIIKLNIVVHCKHCQTNSEVFNYSFICKDCKLPTNDIIQGNEFLINGVEFL